MQTTLVDPLIAGEVTPRARELRWRIRINLLGNQPAVRHPDGGPVAGRNRRRRVAVAPQLGGHVEQIHLHVWLAIFLGGAITSLPVFLAITRPPRRLPATQWLLDRC